MLQDNFLDQPWECEGLDPFRDDPIATESGFEYDDIDEAKSDEENGEVGDEAAPCTCCNLVPSLEERLCCIGFLAGKENINLQVLDNSCIAIK